jgi:hypothetical protein
MMENNENGASDFPRFDEEICERYLFGELTEGEQEEFETAYFADDAFFEKFMAVKTELLDLYSRGELEPGKRARLEPHFLATAPRTRRLAESREFIRTVTSISRRGHVPTPSDVTGTTPSWIDSLMRFFTLPRLAGAVVLLAALGTLFLLSRSDREIEEASEHRPANTTEIEPETVPSLPNSHPNKVQPSAPEVTINSTPANENVNRPGLDRRPESASTNKQKRHGTRPSLANGTPTLPSRGNQTPDVEITIATVGRDPELPSVALHPGSTRDIGGGNTLTLRSGAEDGSAIVSLYFRSERYPRYVVTIATVDGRQVTKNSMDGSSVIYSGDGSKRIAIRLNGTKRLLSKDYIVTLEGRAANGEKVTIEEYYFKVKRDPQPVTTPEDKDP